MNRNRWAYAAAGVVIVISAALGVVIALAATSAGPDTAPAHRTAACKEAMRQQYNDALETGRQGHKPRECDGLSDADLERLAYEVLSEEMNR